MESKQLNIGPIYSKMLILEILTFTYYREDFMYYFWNLSRSTRDFLKDNLEIIINIFGENRRAEYDFDENEIKTWLESNRFFGMQFIVSTYTCSDKELLMRYLRRHPYVTLKFLKLFEKDPLA